MPTRRIIGEDVMLIKIWGIGECLRCGGVGEGGIGENVMVAECWCCTFAGGVCILGVGGTVVLVVVPLSSWWWGCWCETEGGICV